MRTTTLPVSAPVWRLVDADGASIGRLAARIALVLRGKHRVGFSAHQLCGDHVVVVNAAKIAIPPKKGLRKTFYRHTGFPGNLKVTSLTEMMERNPTKAFELAVRGMLPKTRLGRLMLGRLHVFAGAEHKYGAQNPQPLSPLRS